MARIDHPNVVCLVGTGNSPRPFIVMEYLGGGTMNDLLESTLQRRRHNRLSVMGLVSKVNQKQSHSTFSLEALFALAGELAVALEFLHTDAFKGAILIHRGR